MRSLALRAHQKGLELAIAIGREGRVRMPIRQRGVNGMMGAAIAYQWFDNALNPELLQLIAKSSGGQFYRVTEARALDDVFSEIDKLEKTEIHTSQKVRYEEMFQRPLKIGLLLLALEQLLSIGFWRFLL